MTADPEPDESAKSGDAPFIRVFIRRAGQPIEERVGTVAEVLDDSEQLTLAYTVLRRVPTTKGQQDFFYLETAGVGFTANVGPGGDLKIFADDELVLIYGPTAWLELEPRRGAGVSTTVKA